MNLKFQPKVNPSTDPVAGAVFGKKGSILELKRLDEKCICFKDMFDQTLNENRQKTMGQSALTIQGNRDFLPDETSVDQVSEDTNQFPLNQGLMLALCPEIENPPIDVKEEDDCKPTEKNDLIQMLQNYQTGLFSMEPNIREIPISGSENSDSLMKEGTVSVLENSQLYAKTSEVELLNDVQAGIESVLRNDGQISGLHLENFEEIQPQKQEKGHDEKTGSGDIPKNAKVSLIELKTTEKKDETPSIMKTIGMDDSYLLTMNQFLETENKDISNQTINEKVQRAMQQSSLMVGYSQDVLPDETPEAQADKGAAKTLISGIDNPAIGGKERYDDKPTQKNDLTQILQSYQKGLWTQRNNVVSITGIGSENPDPDVETGTVSESEKTQLDESTLEDELSSDVQLRIKSLSENDPEISALPLENAEEMQSRNQENSPEKKADHAEVQNNPEVSLAEVQNNPEVSLAEVQNNPEVSLTEVQNNPAVSLDEPKTISEKNENQSEIKTIGRDDSHLVKTNEPRETENKTGEIINLFGSQKTGEGQESSDPMIERVDEAVFEKAETENKDIIPEDKNVFYENDSKEIPLISAMPGKETESQPTGKAELAGQIGQEILYQLDKNKSMKFQITLDPENLGEIDIQLKFHQGKLIIDIMAFSKETQSLLLEQVDKLIKNMALQNVQVEKVNLNFQTQNNDTNNPSDNKGSMLNMGMDFDQGQSDDGLKENLKNQHSSGNQGSLEDVEDQTLHYKYHRVNYLI